MPSVIVAFIPSPMRLIMVTLRWATSWNNFAPGVSPGWGHSHTRVTATGLLPSRRSCRLGS
jgi:hypothetical protein